MLKKINSNKIKFLKINWTSNSKCNILTKTERTTVFLELTKEWSEVSAFLGLPLFLGSPDVVESIEDDDDDVAGASACEKEIKI